MKLNKINIRDNHHDDGGGLEKRFPLKLHVLICEG